MQFKDKFNLKGEIHIQLKDMNGKIRRIFKHNFLGKIFLRNFGIDINPEKIGLIALIFGYFVKEMVIKNTITNTGKGNVTALMGNIGSPTAFTYLALGIGTTAADASDTALETEITDTGLARAAATITQQTTATSNDTLQLVKQWTATGAKAVTECGIFNASSSGIILGRQVFSAINTADTDQLTITYKVSLS